MIHGRERWYAEMGKDENKVFVYQWLPSPKELKRSRYQMKGRNGFAHPYIFKEEPTEYENPKGNVGVPEEVYRPRIGGDWRHGSPAEWAELRWEVKIRDNFTCKRCGNQSDLQVHGIKGRKSKTINDYETICRKCHLLEHGKTPRVTGQMESRMR